MLVLRRGVVLEAGPVGGPEQRLSVDVAGRGPRDAVADVALVGASEVGDEVVVNTQAVDLAPGSSGFDVVHVNLTRGLEGAGVDGAHVMKLERSSLQHAVLPVERERPGVPLGRPVGVVSLHAQLSPLAWALQRARPGPAWATCRPREARCRAGTPAPCASSASAGCWRASSPPGRPTAASGRPSPRRGRSTTG
jgi:hypothetical protein